MKTIPALLVGSILGNRGSTPRQAGPRHSAEISFCLQADTLLFAEEIFMLMYATAQKRAEQSGKPFVLMLVDLSRLFSICGSGTSPVSIEHRLSEITRDHDHKGWYRTGCVIGIIFNEIGFEQKDRIGRRIIDDLKRSFGDELLERVSLSMQYVYGKKRWVKGEAGDASPLPESPALYEYNAEKSLEW